MSVPTGYNTLQSRDEDGAPIRVNMTTAKSVPSVQLAFEEEGFRQNAMEGLQSMRRFGTGADVVLIGQNKLTYILVHRAVLAPLSEFLAKIFELTRCCCCEGGQCIPLRSDLIRISLPGASATVLFAIADLAYTGTTYPLSPAEYAEVLSFCSALGLKAPSAAAPRGAQAGHLPKSGKTDEKEDSSNEEESSAGLDKGDKDPDQTDQSKDRQERDDFFSDDSRTEAEEGGEATPTSPGEKKLAKVSSPEEKQHKWIHCLQCGDSSKTPSGFAKHLCKHYRQELYKQVSGKAKATGKIICGICNSHFEKGNIFRHIGCKHRELLRHVTKLEESMLQGWGGITPAKKSAGGGGGHEDNNDNWDGDDVNKGRKRAMLEGLEGITSPKKSAGGVGGDEEDNDNCDGDDVQMTSAHRGVQEVECPKCHFTFKHDRIQGHLASHFYARLAKDLNLQPEAEMKCPLCDRCGQSRSVMNHLLKDHGMIEDYLERDDAEKYFGTVGSKQ